MSHWMQWWMMGGYGAYIWASYGLVFTSMCVVIFIIKKQRARTLKRLRHWLTFENSKREHRECM